MHFHFAAFSLLALANTAFAHYRWTKLIANGAATGEYQHVRLNTNYNSPVTDVTSNDIRCNTGTQPNAAKTSTYSVAAGSTIGLGLDHLFGTGPVLLVTGILFGKGLGAYLVYARHFIGKGEVKLEGVPPVAGWSKATPVAGSAPEPHPKADLSAWPYSRGASHAS